MARIRTIKPEFWKNEEIAEISSDAVLLAIGLLNYADDEGYFNANPALIKAEIFPIRKTSSIDTVLLRELSSVDYIQLFLGSDGRKYGQVKKFLEHQVINKPRVSKIKGLCDVPYNYSSDTVVLPVGKERKGREHEVRENKKIVTLENLSVGDVSEWLEEKRKDGKFIHHNAKDVLEIFKDYCKATGKTYKDYVAAYRNAFEWDKCKPTGERDANNGRDNKGNGVQTRPAGRPTVTDAVAAVDAKIARGEI